MKYVVVAVIIITTTTSTIQLGLGNINLQCNDIAMCGLTRINEMCVHFVGGKSSGRDERGRQTSP
jgi:hypothetical protein